MSDPVQLPDEALLRKLLDGTLPADDEARVLALVEAHPSWQEALDRLAAGGQTWQAAAVHLKQPPLAAGAALRSAVAAVAPPETVDEHGPPRVFSAALDFLAPADDPRYLGRFGAYLVEEVVGRGGFGIVLKAFEPQLRRIVALKVLAPHLATSASACRRFTREAYAAAAVVHDHVITIHSVGDEPLPHLVMQYVAGQSLQEKLDQCGPLGIKEVLRIGMQAAAGLAAAHRHGLVHRDIKPANILLENGVERVKITDFGLARAADDASMTQSGTVTGTPQYMSPEQARGESVDFRSDLFSLGSVLYAMCAGHPPFRATTTMGVLKRLCDDPPRPIRKINPEIPDWLAAIIDKLMAKRPADRFNSAQEVSDLLGQCLSHVQQPAVVPLPQGGALAPPVRDASGVAGESSSSLAKTGPQDTRSAPPADLAEEDALLDRARRAVREPAIGLIITGILNWVALAIIVTFFSSFFQRNIFDDAWWIVPVIAALGIGSGLLVVGGLKMLRLESYPLVLGAGVAAMLTGPGYFVGLPIGLWALVVLQRREVKEAIALVRRRHWPGIAGQPPELPEEGEWCARCCTCGYVAPLHKWGGLRLGAVSSGKWTILQCPSCHWWSWMAIERFSAKAQAACLKPQEPTAQRPSSVVFVLLVVAFAVVALPMMLAALAIGGYFFYSSADRPKAMSHVEGGRPFPPFGKVLVDCPDTRFEVRLRYVGPAANEMTVGPALRPLHGQTLDVPAGEYEATVLWNELEVKQDTFTVPADGMTAKYRVPRGGTLRFVAGEGDKNLGLSLNHITGVKFWNWPERQWFVVPAGLVHVNLRRRAGDGAWHILTDNYFDIVADQETVIRVLEKDIELVPPGPEDPSVTVPEEGADAAEAQLPNK
jgi:serine/threonine protein kinase